MAEPVTSTQPLPSPVKTPEVLNPEVVPGGLIDFGQWRHAQDAITALGNTINLIIAYLAGQTVPTPPLPGWAGLGFLALNSGTYNLLPDQNIISVLPPGPITAPSWLFNLPKASTSNGPVTFISFDARFYRVQAFAGDDIVVPNYQTGAFTSVTFVDEGVGGTGSHSILAIYARDHDIDSRWIRTRLEVVGAN